MHHTVLGAPLISLTCLSQAKMQHMPRRNSKYRQSPSMDIEMVIQALVDFTKLAPTLMTSTTYMGSSHGKAWCLFLSPYNSSKSIVGTREYSYSLSIWNNWEQNVHSLYLVLPH